MVVCPVGMKLFNRADCFFVFFLNMHLNGIQLPGCSLERLLGCTMFT